MEDDVSLSEKTRRFLEVETTQKRGQAERLKRYLGKTIEVLAEKVSTRKNCDLTGHSTCHKLVNFPASHELIGSLVNVRILDIKANSLYGEVC